MGLGVNLVRIEKENFLPLKGIELPFPGYPAGYIDTVGCELEGYIGSEEDT